MPMMRMQGLVDHGQNNKQIVNKCVPLMRVKHSAMHARGYLYSGSESTHVHTWLLR